MPRLRTSSVTVTAAALLAVALASGCAAPGNPTGPGSGPVATDAAAPDPTAPTLGPPSVRVLSAGLSAPGAALLAVAGPAGSTYGLRLPTGSAVACGQTLSATGVAAPAGMPVNATERVALRCTGTDLDPVALAAATLLVRVTEPDFTYDFEVPASV